MVSPLVQTTFAVMLGGTLGVAARMWLALWVAARFGDAFPLGTLIINVLGSFIMGLFAGLTGPDGILLVHPLVRQGVMVGILGGFTTFSAFSLQTLELAQSGHWVFAGLNIVLSVILCLLAVWLGALLASGINTRA